MSVPSKAITIKLDNPARGKLVSLDLSTKQKLVEVQADKLSLLK